MRDELARLRPASAAPPGASPETCADQAELMGLALSGGDSRSATFALGVTRALAKLGLLRGFDYLSTVSGGGYIGAWLSALIRRSRKPGQSALDVLADFERGLPQRIGRRPLRKPRPLRTGAAPLPHRGRGRRGLRPRLPVRGSRQRHPQVLDRLRDPHRHDLAPLRPQGDGKHNPSHFAVDCICYPNASEPGVLIYIKASLTGDAWSDVKQYADRHPSFPHQSTADQFFDENQFESYRELGRHIGLKVFAPLFTPQTPKAAEEMTPEQIRAALPLRLCEHPILKSDPNCG
ncbi:MAG: patatin-like phospholipase family protein [Thiobacillus sp.]